MGHDKNRIKTQILQALSHPEADEGLYFRNFFALHEEDERDPVEGDEEELMDALNELVREGKVCMDSSREEVVFQLAPAASRNGGARA